MVEFGVEDKKSLLDFIGEKKGMGSKPLLLFVGDQWENDNLYKSIQNIFIDFFRGDKANKISLKGVDHAIGFTVMDGRIHLRAYNLGYQKSDSKVYIITITAMYYYTILYSYILNYTISISTIQLLFIINIQLFYYEIVMINVITNRYLMCPSVLWVLSMI